MFALQAMCVVHSLVGKTIRLYCSIHLVLAILFWMGSTAQSMSMQIPCCAQHNGHGIIAVGMDFYVVLERPGYRVGRRRRAVSTVGIQHKVTKEDAMKW